MPRLARIETLLETMNEKLDRLEERVSDDHDRIGAVEGRVAVVCDRVDTNKDEIGKLRNGLSVWNAGNSLAALFAAMMNVIK